MTTPRELLERLEWYDNHRLELILSCPRKAFYYLFYRGGLDNAVGPGAHFGSCVHEGLAVYYKLTQQGAEDSKRRLAAMRAFARKYTELFPSGCIEKGKPCSKHTEDNGLTILDDYFDRFQELDRYYRVIEPELGAIVKIEPRDGDPPHFQEPFHYVVRMDIVLEHVRTGEWFVLETKTTGSGVDRRLKQLRTERQGTGYCYTLQELAPQRHVAGVIGNVLLVAPDKREAQRDTFHKSRQDLDQWRRQTIEIVQGWRERVGRMLTCSLTEQLGTFYQRTSACTDYGLCSFYDLCWVGPTYQLDRYQPRTWIPLE